MLEVANSIKDERNPMSEFEERYKPESKTKIEPGSVEKLILKDKVKDHIIRKISIENNITKVYTLIWGQCTESLPLAVKLNGLFEGKSKKN